MSWRSNKFIYYRITYWDWQFYRMPINQEPSFVFVCVEWCLAHIVLYFCCFSLRLMYPMLPVSLDCPLLIASSVFSNVHLSVMVVWAHKANLTPPHLTKVPVLSLESERSCIYVLEVSIWPLSMTCLLDFRTVQTVRYFFFIISISSYSYATVNCLNTATCLVLWSIFL